MKIADKLMNDVEVSKDEMKFLLWNTLIQLSPYEDNVDCVEEESFNVEQMLNTLDEQLGVHSVQLLALDCAVWTSCFATLFYAY